MTGSRFICDPPPMDTDEDYIIYGGNLHIIEEILYKAGFKFTTDPDYDGGNWFLTFRLNEFNIIATDSEAFFERFVSATLLAKSRNLLDKSDRIALFQKILYGDVVGKSSLFKKKNVDEKEII
ncbi:MAG: hypothetical protein H6546_07495 [Chitinophagales bacterium]|nr:hypothetical protein [Chitinophagales bacterium]